MSFLALLFAVLAAIAVLRPRRDRRGALGFVRAIAPYAAVVLIAPGVIALWYFHRPQPASAKPSPLFRGVSYERDVRTSPRPVVAHVVRIDLREPSISFLVTPHTPGGWLRGATTSQFLLANGVQLAINGDYFLPWWSEGLLDVYPQPGDPTDVLGASVSNGVLRGWQATPYTALVFGPDRSVSIVEITGPSQRLPPARQAVSGKQLLVDEGRKTAEASATPQARLAHPRTAAALDRSGRTLLLFAVDGRQPGYSEGITLDELAGLILEHGGHRALNLDGGGSTALVIDDGAGGARQLNIPIHTRWPWRERQVGNHLGVLAAPL
jgi:hypothetical protein